MQGSVVDVKELVRKYSVAELNEAAEQYWLGMRNSQQVQSKPYTLSEVQHLLVQIAHLIGGLSLYPDLTVLDFGAGTMRTGSASWRLAPLPQSCPISPS